MLKIKYFTIQLLLINFAYLNHCFAEQELLGKCSDEICFSQHYQLDNNNFILSGTATHRYWGFRLFTAALYVPALAEVKPTFDNLGVYPLYLVLEYRRKFKAQDFIDSSEKFMKKNPQIPFDRIYSEWQEMNKLYQDVKQKDRYGILYIPSKGINLYLNEKFIGFVSGDDFAKSYLSVWLAPWGLSKDFAEVLWDKNIF